MAVWVVEISKGDTKLDRFLPKNQHTQRKILNFEFWINGELSTSAKIWLSKSISYLKNHPKNLSNFVPPLENSISNPCCHTVYTSRTVSSVILLTDSGNPIGISFKFVTRHGMFLEWWYIKVNKSQKQNNKFSHTPKNVRNFVNFLP